jgi:uncharacterized membrane protein (UPF0127 family)
MRFPIDVIFLDAQNRCLRLISDLKPWHWARESTASHVLELRAGLGVELFIQDHLLMDRKL